MTARSQLLVGGVRSGAVPVRARIPCSQQRAELAGMWSAALPAESDGARRPLRSIASPSGLREQARARLRWRAAIAFLRSLDLESGRIPRQVLARALQREIGFESSEGWRWIAPARGDQRAPAAATAFRGGAPGLIYVFGGEHWRSHDVRAS